MNRKRQRIVEKIEKIEQRLANAREYVARDVNVEGSSFLHFGDWKGKSGHPAWMRNFMIPALLRGRARKEKTLQELEAKRKDKLLRLRRRAGAKRRSA